MRSDFKPKMIWVSDHRRIPNEHARLIDHSLLPLIIIFIDASRSPQECYQRLAAELFATTTLVYLQSRSFQSVQWSRPF